MPDLIENLSQDELRDIRDTVDIWHRVYPDQAFDDATLAYKYYANPERLDSPVTFCLDEGGRRVGTIWNTGIHVVRGENERHRCSQSGDSMTLPEARGLTFLRAVRAEKEQLLAQGVRFRLGNPNEMAFPVITRLGDVPAVKLASAHAEAPETGIAFPDGAGSEGLTVKSFDRVPFLAEDYAAMNRRHGRYCVERSEAYFTWRIDGQDAKRFTYYRLADASDVMLGYAILRDLDGRCEIVDWNLTASDRATQTRHLKALLARMPLAARAVDVGELNIACGEPELFTACGFDIVPDETGQPAIEYVTVKPLADDCDEALLDGANWLIRRIDLDYFMN